MAWQAFGGRLDQQMANLNMAYRYKGFRDFFLLSEHSIAFVLEPGGVLGAGSPGRLSGHG